MSLMIKLGAPAVTVKATFLDKAGEVDAAGKVSFAVDSANLTMTDNGDGTASIVGSVAGPANLTATDTDPDGNTVTTPPFAVSVVDSTHDAVTGSISVVTPPAPVPAPVPPTA